MENEFISDKYETSNTPDKDSSWTYIYWVFIHVSAIGCTTPTKRNAFIRMMSTDNIIETLIQCLKCSNNYATHLQEYPIEEATDLYLWTCNLHNIVNHVTNEDIIQMKAIYEAMNWEKVYWTFIHKSAAGTTTQDKRNAYKKLMTGGIMSILWYSSEFNSISLNISGYMSSNIELLNWSCELHNRINIMNGKTRVLSSVLHDIKRSYLKGINVLNTNSNECTLCNVDISSIPNNVSSSTRIPRNEKVKLAVTSFRNNTYMWS